MANDDERDGTLHKFPTHRLCCPTEEPQGFETERNLESCKSNDVDGSSGIVDLT